MNLTSTLSYRRVFLFLVVIAGLHCSWGTRQRAFALDPKRSISQYIHKVWTIENGLPENSVAAMIQRGDGYLWLATQEGLARFDGLQFAVYDMTNTKELLFSNVEDLLLDHDGHLWLKSARTSPRGVARMIDGKFTSMTTANGLVSNSINNMAVGADGAIWFVTMNGINRYYQGQFSTMTTKDGLASDSVLTVYQGRSGDLWFATTKGVCLFREGKFITYTTKEGLAADRVFVRQPGESVQNTIFEDKDGGVWFGTQNGLSYFWKGAFKTYTTKDGLANNRINCFHEDKKGNLWIGTLDGLNKFERGKFMTYRSLDARTNNNIAKIVEDKDENLWLRPKLGGLLRLSHGTYDAFSTPDGLSDNDVSTILEDKEGTLWVGTNGNGLNMFSNGKFITYSVQNGLPNELAWVTLEDRDGALWVGTNDGLAVLRDGKISVYNAKDGLSGNSIQAICEDSVSGLWIGTFAGLTRYKDGRFRTFTAKEGFPYDQVTSLFTDSHGTIMIGGPGINGLVRYSNGTFTTLKSDSEITGRFRSILESRDGGTWIGTGTGLIRMRNGKVVAHYTTRDGLSSDLIFSLYEDREGVLWICTASDGITRFKDGKFSPVRAKDGLFDDVAYVIVEDDAGNFWMTCNKGIYRASRKDLNDFCDGRIPSISCTVYGTADGMKSRECNGGTSPAAWRMRDGRLCFVTAKGVTIINPADIKINTVPPPVSIERVLVDNEPMDLGGQIELPPGKERFEFRYAGLTFIGAERVVYKYMLDGFDKTWVDAGTRREAFYTNIPHGSYTFRVVARNSDGIWNEQGASFLFALKPHFYQTTWFYALVLLFLAFVGPSIYLLRVRQLKSRQLELLGMVREKTKELTEEKDKTDAALVQNEAAKNEADRNRARAEEALHGLKEAQQQLVLSEKMASLGQLTAGIAHEIKNPLNFVNNFAVLSTDLMTELREELAKPRNATDDKAAGNIEEILDSLEQNVKKINDHGRRADSIVKGMLLHSRGKAGERQPTDLNALLAEYVNLAYHGMRAQDHAFNIKIETDFDPEVGVLEVVPQDLSRAFLNIVNNGCYAANERKKLHGNGLTPTLRVTTRSKEDGVEIRIRDNGTGIPANIADKIFHPFFTTKPAGVGTGLGLSLTYDIIVHEHKGTLTVDSKEGEFTEFVITVPRHAT